MAKAAKTVIDPVPFRDSLCNSSAKGIVSPVVVASDEAQSLIETVLIHCM